MARRPETEILRDILDVYCALSPENLSADGELPLSAIRSRKRKLDERLQALQKELGRNVSEEEAFGL